MMSHDRASDKSKLPVKDLAFFLNELARELTDVAQLTNKPGQKMRITANSYALEARTLAQELLADKIVVVP